MTTAMNCTVSLNNTILSFCRVVAVAIFGFGGAIFRSGAPGGASGIECVISCAATAGITFQVCLAISACFRRTTKKVALNATFLQKTPSRLRCISKHMKRDSTFIAAS